jgi:chorismate mutase/prephenate dehydratase
MVADSSQPDGQSAAGRRLREFTAIRRYWGSAGFTFRKSCRVEVIEAGSSTKAAAIAATEPNAASISSTVAAELFNLTMLEENIEDFSNNTTRFLIIGNQEPAPTGDDKTSVCFAIKDKVGALYDSIKPFKDEGVTMTMIESRPTRAATGSIVFH